MTQPRWPALLGQTRGVIAFVTADGAYDGKPAYAAAAARRRHPPLEDVVLLRVVSAVSNAGAAATPKASVTATSNTWPSAAA